MFELVRDLAAAFARERIRYLFVGGIAVIAHGYTRLTQDLDVVLDLDDAANVDRTLDVLERLGWQPRAPLPLRSFADAQQRARWQVEQDMIAFTCWRDGRDGDATELDLFLASPFPFADAWRDRLEVEVEDGLVIPIVDLGRLLAMKDAAGRPKDQEDARMLRDIADA